MNNTKNPKVTIIFSAYNHAQYVKKSLESVLEQTYSNFEIIAIDNGSIDKTGEIIQSISDPKIRFYSFNKNQGISHAINLGLEKARGEYISFMGSDDIFFKDKLQKQIQYLELNKKVGGVFSQVELIDENDKILKKNSHFYHDLFSKKNIIRYEWLNYFFYSGNCLCYSTACIRKSCFSTIGFNDRRLAQLHDFDMWVGLVLSYDIHIIQQPLVKFRVRSENKNVSANTPETQVRSVYEFGHILKRFLSIDTIETFIKVFPEEKKKHKDIVDNKLIPFYVARAALDVEHVFHQKFALDTLYSLLKNKSLIKKLNETCNFDFINFIGLTGKHDYYRIQQIESQYQEIDTLQKDIDTLQQTSVLIKKLVHKLLFKNA